MKTVDQPSKLAERFLEINSGPNGVVLSHLGFDLLQKMLTYDPSRRIKAHEALNHPWFREEPIGISPEQMPKFKAFNTVARENKRQKELERLRDLEEERLLQAEEGLKL